MSFVSIAFLSALVAAAGPLIIHLLNRRRFRTVEWAAMDFLRSAIRRSKRVMEIRDIMLLVLRTLAVIFFILAMAQPFWTSGSDKEYDGGPVHAVLVIDNSLSMAYRPLDKTLMDEAKARAAGFIRELPAGSRISILPLCARAGAEGRSAYSSTEDALEALDRIVPMDRDGRASDAAEMARRACQELVELPTKRVVLIGDMQRQSWDGVNAKTFEGLGGVQVVAIGPADRSNVWISDFQVLDGMADVESPAVFTTTLRYHGEAPRPGVRVMLKIGGEPADDRTVNMNPGQHLQLTFEHRFDVAGTAGEPLYVPVELSVSRDELEEDNRRTIMVPVVSQLPVVFIDQYGADEVTRMNRYGETYPLRRLLTGRNAAGKQRIAARHLTIAQLNREAISEARLVVIAGVRSPSDESVEILREYVSQGGQLFIAAGGEFDAGAWSEAGWRGGDGILPAPLRDIPVGKLPPPTVREWSRFGLNPESLAGEAFDLSLNEAEKRELVSGTFFYKAVGVDTDAMGTFADALKQRLEREQAQRAELAEAEKKWADLAKTGRLSAEEARKRDEARAKTEGGARWLKWTNLSAEGLEELSVEQLLAYSRPAVLGRYDNGEVFALRRNLGKGTVIMMTSGCFPGWNNIAADASVVLLDSMLRSLLTHSLPGRNLASSGGLVLPVAARDQNARFELLLPGDESPRDLAADPISTTRFGLRLSGLERRGVHTIRRLADETSAGTPQNGWTMQFALNGPAHESDLSVLGDSEFKKRYRDAGLKLLDENDPISLAGAFTTGRNLWKWLLFLAIVCLVVEMVMLKENRPEEKPA